MTQRSKSQSDEVCKMDRRRFIKMSTAATAVGVAWGGMPFKSLSHAGETEHLAIKKHSAIKPGACPGDCGCKCLLNHHVEDGVLSRTESDYNSPDLPHAPQARGCLKGRSTRRRIYSPDRLKYPMKRVGNRGEGRFERISWNEAYDILADRIKETRRKYGNEAFFVHHGMALEYAALNCTWHSESPIARLMNLYGGYIGHTDSYSFGQSVSAFNLMYGEPGGNSIDDLENTDLFINWGTNLGETSMGGAAQMYALKRLKEKRNFKMVYIDPRYSDTCCGKEDQWIPIRPGTDAALASALAYVMITEDLVDQKFLDKYCVGYDDKTLPSDAPINAHYKAYILGNGEDKTRKTPKWAEQITGVPASTIVQLAREIASVNRCNIMISWGVNRHAEGETTVRAISTLACLTGNIGVHGGNAGYHHVSYGGDYPMTLPTAPNPVGINIPIVTWLDGVERKLTAKRDRIEGAESTSTPFKFVWCYGNNFVATHPDSNHVKKVIADESKLETLVVIDTHMTPTAKYADILLPDVSNAEREEIEPADAHAGADYRIYVTPAIPPMFESRDCYSICQGIAKRLGVEKEYTEGRTGQDWLRWFHEEARKRNPGMISFKEFQKRGIVRMESPDKKPVVGFKDFRDDPVANPLSTESGKIEIYSSRIARDAKELELEPGQTLRALPEYIPEYRGYNDKLAAEYPLQLIGWHSKTRALSIGDNVDYLRELTNKVWINPIDAKKRGLSHGDRVEVFNDRGRVTTEAKVTTRIMPGVIAMPIGSWNRADKDGVDHNACINVLTYTGASTYCKGSAQHTNLADVKLWNGGESHG